MKIRKRNHVVSLCQITSLRVINLSQTTKMSAGGSGNEGPDPARSAALIMSACSQARVILDWAITTSGAGVEIIQKQTIRQ